MANKTEGVTLPENLTITNAESLHQQLENYTRSDNDITLDGAAVKRVDTAGLQVLYAFSQTLQRNGINFTWSATSGPLVSAARLLGMDKRLAL